MDKKIDKIFLKDYSSTLNAQIKNLDERFKDIYYSIEREKELINIKSAVILLEDQIKYIQENYYKLSEMINNL